MLRQLTMYPWCMISDYLNTFLNLFPVQARSDVPDELMKQAERLREFTNSFDRFSSCGIITTHRTLTLMKSPDYYLAFAMALQHLNITVQESEYDELECLSDINQLWCQVISDATEHVKRRMWEVSRHTTITK